MSRSPHDGAVYAHALTLCRFGEVCEEERRHLLAGELRDLSELQRLGQRGVMSRRIEFVGRVDGIGEQHPTARDVAMRGERVGGLLGRLDAPVEPMPGRRHVEAGELLRAVADDRHAERLQALERRGDVEDRFHARRDDEDGDDAHRLEICRDVPGRHGAAVDPTEPAGRHHRRCPPAGKRDGPSDGRRPVDSARDREAEVPRGQLGDRGFGVGEAFDLGGRQPHDRDAGDHADRRGLGPLVPDVLFELAGDLEVVRARQPVGDEGRLERDDTASIGEGLADVVPDTELATGGNYHASGSVVSNFMSSKDAGHRIEIDWPHLRAQATRAARNAYAPTRD